jgi:hypothetical protein
MDQLPQIADDREYEVRNEEFITVSAYHRAPIPRYGWVNTYIQFLLSEFSELASIAVCLVSTRRHLPIWIDV